MMKVFATYQRISNTKGKLEIENNFSVQPVTEDFLKSIVNELSKNKTLRWDYEIRFFRNLAVLKIFPESVN